MATVDRVGGSVAMETTPWSNRGQRDLVLRRTLIGSAAVMAGGVFGPWYVIDVFIASYSANGFSAGPGVVVLVLAGIAGACAFSTLRSAAFSPTILLAMAAVFGLGFLVAGRTFLDIQQGIQVSDVVAGADFSLPAGLFVRPGWGLWLTLIGSLVGAGVAAIVYREQHASTRVP